MRLLIQGTGGDVEVVAEPFSIDGTSDGFAVHPSIECLSGMGGFGNWSATHIPTGMVVARGESVEDTIIAAHEKWLSCTPEKIAQAIAEGHKRQQEMLASRKLKTASTRP